MGKLGSIKIKIGSYVKDGQTKGKYIDAGVLMQSQDGGMYILLSPHVNLAGIPMGDGKDMVMCSIFTDNQQQQGQQQNYQQQATPQNNVDDQYRHNVGGNMNRPSQQQMQNQQPPPNSQPPVEYYDAQGSRIQQ